MSERVMSQPVLVFRWGPRRWAIPSALVEEVIAFSPPTPTPTRCGLLGVVPQRGELMGVLEPSFLGDGDATATRVLVCRRLDGLVGVPTTGVEGLVTPVSDTELDEDISVLNLSSLLDEVVKSR